MSLDIKGQFEYITQPNFSYLAELPVIYHCHHFNLFLDQTIQDALGPEDSIWLRTKAAHDATYHLLSNLFSKLRVDTPVERIQAASTVFAAMGHGSLNILANHGGGTMTGDYLHYGYAWLQKYGQQIRRRTTADPFAAGFGAAAVEVAYDLPKGSLWGREEACIANREDQCQFSIQPHNHSQHNNTPHYKEEQLALVKQSLTCKYEPNVAAITEGLVGFLGTLSTDSRGLLEGFGVIVALHLTEYCNRISYGALELLQQKNPSVVPMLETLLRESGHVCVFNTFGGILRSPEWEGMVGLPGRTKDMSIYSCTAIARALGFGHWAVAEFVPEQRLVLRCAGTYEAVHYLNHIGRSNQPRCYFLQGAAVAFMQLTHSYDWDERAPFTQELYDSLFRKGLTWQAQETKCMTMGDDYCEVVVTRKAQ